MADGAAVAILGGGIVLEAVVVGVYIYAGRRLERLRGERPHAER